MLGDLLVTGLSAIGVEELASRPGQGEFKVTIPFPSLNDPPEGLDGQLHAWNQEPRRQCNLAVESVNCAAQNQIGILPFRTDRLEDRSRTKVRQDRPRHQ